MITLKQKINNLAYSNIVLNAKATKRGHGIFIELIKFIIVLFTTETLIGKVSEFLNEHFVNEDTNQIKVLFTIGLLSIGAIIFCYIYENMNLSNLGIVKLGIIKDTSKGYIIGFVLISAVSLILFIINSVSFTVNIINVNFSEYIILFLIYFFQAFGEEVMYRGYLMISLSRKNSIILAVLLSSAAFSIHHVNSPGFGIIAFINLFLLGVVLSISILKSNNIWVATGIHSAWNFIQGNLFGMNVSGGKQPEQLTILMLNENWGPNLYGAQMGLEGSIIATVVLILTIVFFISNKNGLFTNKKALVN